MDKPQKQTVHPDWITGAQWDAVPSIAWWEARRHGAELLAQQKPVTAEEALAQFERLRSEKNCKSRVIEEGSQG